jgi:hypothetical protein
MTARDPGAPSAPVTSSGTPALAALAAAASRSAPSSERDPWLESPATLDLFTLGRRAAAARDERLGPYGSFVRARQWLPASSAVVAGAGGGWRGPRDASLSFADLADFPDLAAEAALAEARAAGVTSWLGLPDADLHRALVAAGGRVIWRFPFRAGEAAAERRDRLLALQLRAGAPLTRIWGVLPSPVGEAEGIDSLRVVAALRLDLAAVPHLLLDVAALGPRLAQMALGFGGDELWAPIVSERALRLGGNANNPAMTRKEAAVLIRGAGLRPRERLGATAHAGQIDDYAFDDRYQEEVRP